MRVSDIGRLEFSIGFELRPAESFTIERNGDAYRASGFSYARDGFTDIVDISAATGDKLLSSLLNDGGIEGWQLEYQPSYAVLDGYRWHLEVLDNGGSRIKESTGWNAPAPQDEFLAVLAAIRTLRPGFGEEVEEEIC